MYVSPFVSRDNSYTPQEFKTRARNEIQRKLNIKPSITATPDLRHGSSPLNKVINASDTSLNRMSSNESMESVESAASAGSCSVSTGTVNGNTANSGEEKHRRLFGLGKLKRHISRGNSKSSSLNIVHESEQADAESEDVEMTEEVYRTDTNQSTITSHTGYQQSLFSNQHSLATQLTNISLNDPQTAKQQSQQQIYLTLEECLPSTYTDLYSPELLANPSQLTNGRPTFLVSRPLQNWALNDIRSLLILSELKHDWHGQIPVIYNPQGFKVQLLPLSSSDEQIIQTLAESDIYKEAQFEWSFRVQTAKYTVCTARARHDQYHNNSSSAWSKPEWRNIIENFMLNLGVENQCRMEYKLALAEFKKFKKSESTNRDKGNLLKKALLNEGQQAQGGKKIGGGFKLSKEEKFQLWQGVQGSVYQRLGLDWKPDN
ncbi:hypothetical protein WICPIJ_009489 [Wickerhamomyces pijperi]|uniref:Uncharacterized protein n=1 Tax=Wickerhamomyces pijperi TaxID=599730 RepID=A0A9P8PNK9_WICPI|nr:hypothetical protein WICPIJ_009489 [Wickerhamomyces pijperi]